MCGPICVSLSMTAGQGKAALSHLMYHLGRIFTYTMLGAAMGLTGSFTAVIDPMLGVQKAVLIGTGCLILIMGLGMTGWVPKLDALFGDGGGGFVLRWFKKLLSNRKPLAVFPLGVMLGFLPCGPVYAAMAAAARAGMTAGSPAAATAAGAGITISFGVGTVPALLLVGGMSNLPWIKNRGILNKAAAVLVISAGMYYLYRGLG